MLGLDDLVFADGVQSYLDSRRKIVENADKVFLFGSARGGEKVYSYLLACNLHSKIIFVADNDKMKQGKKFHGIPIISAEEMCAIFPEYRNACVLIASGSAHIIRNQLLSAGIPENVIYPFVITMLQLSPTPCQYFLRRKKEIAAAYNLLADEKSKDVFISLLNYKMLRDPKILGGGISDNEHDQYFDELMRLTDHESFVDCGAYVGDTLDEFFAKVAHWDNYFCFEADSSVFAELKKHVVECGYERVQLYNVGCWDKQDTLFFEKLGSGSSSIVSSEKGIQIKADSLDNILRNEKVSIIKMDIEGAEQKALAGAERIIAEQHPKLAISSYHSLEDFIRIPQILKSYSADYQIYIRHYRELSDSETICYAV